MLIFYGDSLTDMPKIISYQMLGQPMPTIHWQVLLRVNLPQVRKTIIPQVSWASVGLWREAERLEDGWVMVISHTEGLQVL